MQVEGNDQETSCNRLSAIRANDLTYMMLGSACPSLVYLLIQFCTNKQKNKGILTMKQTFITVKISNCPTININGRDSCMKQSHLHSEISKYTLSCKYIISLS